MAINLSDDELLAEMRRRKLGGIPGANGVTVTTEQPLLAGSALDRPAYNQTGRTRVVTDPNAATNAEVAVIRAARTRNPNTPAQFDQMTDAGRAAHWDRYFSGPPKPASNFPVASDFGGASAVGTPQTPSQFWKTYAAVRSGTGMNTPMVSPEEAAARMAGTVTPSDVSRASGASQADGGGFRAQTPYGPIALNTSLAPEAKSGRFAGGQKTWGTNSAGPDWAALDAADRAYDPSKDPNNPVKSDLPAAVPVSPIPAVRKSLIDMAPDAYPNIDQSLPPSVPPPLTTTGPVRSGIPTLDELLRPQTYRRIAVRNSNGTANSLTRRMQGWPSDIYGL